MDTFEYRLLREKEFRQSITRREAGEADAEIPAQPTSGPITPPQISQKARNSKLLEGSDATFTAKISANPAPRVSRFFSSSEILGLGLTESRERDFLAQTLGRRNANNKQTGVFLPFNSGNKNVTGDLFCFAAFLV